MIKGIETELIIVSRTYNEYQGATRSTFIMTLTILIHNRIIYNFSLLRYLLEKWKHFMIFPFFSYLSYLKHVILDIKMYQINF